MAISGAGMSPVLTAANASAVVMMFDSASCWKNWRSEMFSGSGEISAGSHYGDSAQNSRRGECPIRNVAQSQFCPRSP
ncbi:hypothetical protein EI171_39745 [Bradyrhizobium sp. LCT2]|nr:hypothetical protein EI171_39745 [Bradyrhizobium sp. LCT2]